MTAPVTTTVAPARPGRGPDRGDPAAGAGFASALDGAMATGREAPGSGVSAAHSNRRESPRFLARSP